MFKAFLNAKIKYNKIELTSILPKLRYQNKL
jgi:pyruvoyl-dependent arginine decarboxylase (PvlArgDC)